MLSISYPIPGRLRKKYFCLSITFCFCHLVNHIDLSSLTCSEAVVMASISMRWIGVLSGEGRGDVGLVDAVIGNVLE
jgi:hypothetical protein